MERSTNKLPKTPDKVNRSIFSSTQGDAYRTKTPTKPFSNEAIPERLNFSIETKKKASIIEKISNLAPFLESLINKSQIRSSQILDRLLELRTHLDEIFDEISLEFQAAQVENDDLRKSLEDAPRQRAHAMNSAQNQRLQRLVDQLRGQLQQIRSKEAHAAQQLSQLRNENRDVCEILENLKRQTERLKTTNSDLQNKLREISNRPIPKGISPEEYRILKEELDKERGKTMGLEEYSRKKLAEIEARLAAENKKYRDLESIHAQLSRKSDLKEEEIRQLKELVDREGRKSLSFQENARRKIQQTEQTNAELRRKIEQDESDIQARVRRIQDLEAQNAERERRLREFTRKSEITEKEIAMLKEAMENERRQSMANEQGLLMKLKQIENQKRGLIDKARDNEGKAKEYEDILEKLTTEVQRDRRESMLQQKNATQKIRSLEGRNVELGRQIDSTKQTQAEKDRELRQLYESIKEKERQYKDYVQDLTRKSNLHEDEIRILKDELDKERRKSLADEATIKRLQRVIEDQTKNTKDQVAMLQSELENERRKSMADEAKIRKLEQILNEKVYFLNENEKKNKLADDQIGFLKNEIENERRKSMADEAKIKKLEQILNEKEKYLGEVDKKGRQADEDIRRLREEIENERRKSMADEAKIRKLEQQLNDKMKVANETHNKYLELARKSEINDEELRLLKAQIEKERRKSTQDEATIHRLEQLLAERQRTLDENKKKEQANDDQIRFLRNQIEKERRKSMADETKIKKLEEMLKEKVTIAEQFNSRYLDQVRKTEVNAQQIKFLMAELDKERRKSMADEATIKRLEKLIAQKIKYSEDAENRYVNEIKILKKEIDDERRKSMADETKIKKLQEMLNEKLREAEGQKAKIMELARKTDLNENQIRTLQAEIDKERRKSMADVAMIKKLEAIIAEKSRVLQEKEESYIKNNDEIQMLKNEIDKERRKSMQDEAQIKKLEQLLDRKLQQAHETQRRYEELARKSNLDADEINFLKDQIEKERRNSAIGQDNFVRKVRELEGTKDDLMKKLEEDKQRFIKTANYIKQLEEKNQNAERLYSDAARKTDMDAELIERLKAEMDNERRKSTSMEQTFLPKIRLLVDENQSLTRDVQALKERIKQADDKIAQLTEHLNRSKQAIQFLENESRNKDRAIGDLQRTVEQVNYSNQQKLSQSIDEKNRIVRDLESELNQAKQDRSNLQQQLSSKTTELQRQREAINQLERVIGDRESALAQEESNNQALAKVLNEMKAKERELIDRNNQLTQQNANNNIIYEQHLQGTMSQGMIRKPLTETNINTASTIVVSETSRQERQHVIKVLEHERRIYKLETSITKQKNNRVEVFDSHSNQDIEPFDTEFGQARQDVHFDGRTSSPMRLGGGNEGSGSKRPRILSDI